MAYDQELADCIREREDYNGAHQRACLEIERLRAELDAAVRTIRAWHGGALAMRDASITGKGDIEDLYFDLAMRHGSYGCDEDPLPSQRNNEQTERLQAGDGK